MARTRHGVEPVLSSAIVRLRPILSLTLSLALLTSCSSKKSFDPLAEQEGEPGEQDSGKEGSAGSIDIPTKPTPDGACGFEAIEAKQDPANLYFVIDRSGSMAMKPPGSSMTKYTAVGNAVVSLVRKIGWRSRIGMTVFPGANSNSCSAGNEVLQLQPGDSKKYLDQSKIGPIAKALSQVFQVTPNGGTPTGATLAALVPKASTFGKDSFVILATDGAPNCNPSSMCDESRCIINIEHDSGCPTGHNCCDPSISPYYSPLNCVDGDATLAAIKELAKMGVKTIVIGIPGSELGPYAELLSELAIAGGLPKDGAVRYYQVQDVSELETLFASLGSNVLVSCDVSLAQVPSDAEKVNLYFDDELIRYDDEDGWTWTGEQSLKLHGKACDKLLGGGVNEMQIFVGCPTEATH